MQKNTIKYDLLLFLTSFIWGTAFVAQSKGMDHLGPLTFTGLRFLLGGLVLVPILVYNKGRKTDAKPDNRKLVPLSILTGLVLFAAAALQQIGLLTTTAGKAGFITGLYITIVPFLGLLVGHKIGWSTVFGCVLAFAGMFLLSMEKNFIIQRGDLLVLAGAFFWALHVQLVGYLAKRFNPLHVACIQFFACGTASLILAQIIPMLSSNPEFIKEGLVLENIKLASISIFYAGVMSVGVGFTLQVVSQQFCPPTHAAIIMSQEMSIAALAGWLILGEVFNVLDIFGCILMLAGVIAVQLIPILKSRTKPPDIPDIRV